jgi:hypothetical protein
MSIERQSKLWSGPPIVPADPATEREQLIAANQAFAAALKKALHNGAETACWRQSVRSTERTAGFPRNDAGHLVIAIAFEPPAFQAGPIKIMGEADPNVARIGCDNAGTAPERPPVRRRRHVPEQSLSLRLPHGASCS